MNGFDYGRSYLRFRSDRVNHSPRLQLDASCVVRTAGGQERRFVLTSPCIGERMYVETGLIHEPPFEFLMVGEHQAEYAIHRRRRTVERDEREVHRFDEAMQTVGGVPARIRELDVHLASYDRVEPIETYEAFRDALLENRPVNGRTSYLAEDGQTTVALEYPAKTMNVAHDRPAWQVDAGPLIVPDLSRPLAPDEPLVGRFDLAYLVFNRWDYAEMAIYSRVRGLTVRNELFCGTSTR